MAGMTTATATDMFNALKKRMQTQGFSPTDTQVQTLAIDAMNVANTDSANVVSHAATEVVVNPPRKFAPGV